MADDLSERLKLMYVSLYRDNEFERGNAAAKQYEFWLNHNIHPIDVKLSVGNADDTFAREARDVINHLSAAVQRLERQNAYLLRHVSDTVAREAAGDRQIDPKNWLLLRDLMIRHWSRDQQTLPIRWKHRLATLLRVPRKTIKEWETGVREVPLDVVQQMQEQMRDHPRKSRHNESLSSKQVRILRAIYVLGECPIRLLSLQLYNKDYTNTTLDDAVQALRQRKLVDRRDVIPGVDRNYGQAQWLYFLTKAGKTQLGEP